MKASKEIVAVSTTLYVRYGGFHQLRLPRTFFAVDKDHRAFTLRNLVTFLVIDDDHFAIERGNDFHFINSSLCSIHCRLRNGNIIRVWSILNAVILALCTVEFSLGQFEFGFNRLFISASGLLL